LLKKEKVFNNLLFLFRNIKRVVFSNIQKFDGKEVRPISIPQLKQIAGRAGRFGTAYGNGIVTA
jgi:ATP-dependent RNA helicase SUPV3L1/SUV3